MGGNDLKSLLRPVQFGPVVPSMIEDFAYAVEDYNQVHLDKEFAISAGFRDIIAHGPLTMSYMSKMLMQVFRPEQIKMLETRFQLPTYMGDTITIHCEDVCETEEGFRITLTAVNQDGNITTKGTAEINIAR